MDPCKQTVKSYVCVDLREGCTGQTIRGVKLKLQLCRLFTDAVSPVLIHLKL